MKTVLYSLSILLLALLSACDPERIYDDNKDIEEINWKKEDTLTFGVEIKEAGIPCNLYYNVRYTNEYPFYNMFTKYFIYSPEGKLLKSPSLPEDMYLFDMKTGAPFGKGIGSIYDQRIGFLKDYKFESNGKYTIKVVQYMRNEPLPGIVSFGIRVEKAVAAKEN